jgi:biotin transport system substrate-specific component
MNECAKTRIVDATTIKKITFTALMTAVMCILSPLSIPIGPVPITLSVACVFLCVYALGAKLGSLACGIYILLGLVGLPVFSGFAGGPAKLFGPTGGYIVGYIFMALLSGWFIDRFPMKKFYIQVVGMLLGLVVLYAFGTAWFVFQMKVTFAEALSMCVIPFIAFDMIKIGLALVLGNTVRKALSMANLMSYYN